MKEIFQSIPFYNDFHALVYLENDNTAKLVVNEEAVRSVIEQMAVMSVVSSRDYPISRHTHKMNITRLELTNNYSVAIIRKDYIWDYFQSTGVIVVLSMNSQQLEGFLQKTYLDKVK